MKKPSVRPRGYTSVTASLAVADVAEMLNFLTNAFGAEVQVQDNEEAPAFASVKLGNAMIFVTAGWAATGHLPQSPAAAGAVALHLYVENAAAAVEQAVKAGATLTSEIQDTYWGERVASVADTFGHRWTIAERVEVLKPAEIAARAAATSTAPASTSAELVDETELS